jgi:hypothetical protein
MIGYVYIGFNHLAVAVRVVDEVDIPVSIYRWLPREL